MGLEATVISDFKETWEHKLATLLRETAVPDTADEFHVDPEAFQPYPRGVPPMQPTQYYAAPPQTYVPAPAPASMAAVQQAQQRRALAQQRAMGQPRMPGYDGPANLHVDSDSVPGPSAVEPQITQEELHNILSKEFIPRESKSRQSRQKLAQSDGPKPGSEESDSFDEDELDNDPDNDVSFFFPFNPSLKI